MSKKNKSFEDHKIFVMTRPEPGSDLLKITTSDQSQKNEELDELYHVCFFDYFLNLSKFFSVKEHKLLITTLTAPIAYQMYITDQERSQKLIAFTLKNLTNTKQEEMLLNMPDMVSQLDFIIRNNLHAFLTDIRKKGLEQALITHNIFYADLENVFFMLPACFCFGLINAALQINPKLGKYS